MQVKQAKTRSQTMLDAACASLHSSVLAEVVHGVMDDSNRGSGTCQKADVHLQAAGVDGIGCVI